MKKVLNPRMNLSASQRCDEVGFVVGHQILQLQLGVIRRNPGSKRQRMDQL
jgi:hypothetical protein